MSRNSTVTPEGPGNHQGQSAPSTDITSTSPNAINNVDLIQRNNNQFIAATQYPMYHQFYPYPIGPLLGIPPSTMTQNQAQNSLFVANGNINTSNGGGNLNVNNNQNGINNNNMNNINNNNNGNNNHQQSNTKPFKSNNNKSSNRHYSNNNQNNNNKINHHNHNKQNKRNHHKKNYHHHNKQNYNHYHHHNNHNNHHSKQSNNNNHNNHNNGNNNNSMGNIGNMESNAQIQKCKSKTVDLSRKNSRGELETLVRWIGGDSIQIKHHCSQDAEHNAWHCICTVPLPPSIQQSLSVDIDSLKTESNHSKKKDAIKLASKLMIEEILKQPLPISVDVINKDQTITSIPAKLHINKNQILSMKQGINMNNINKSPPIQHPQNQLIINDVGNNHNINNNNNRIDINNVSNNDNNNNTNNDRNSEDSHSYDQSTHAQSHCHSHHSHPHSHSPPACRINKHPHITPYGDDNDMMDDTVTPNPDLLNDNNNIPKNKKNSKVPWNSNNQHVVHNNPQHVVNRSKQGVPTSSHHQSVHTQSNIDNNNNANVTQQETAGGPGPGPRPNLSQNAMSYPKYNGSHNPSSTNRPYPPSKAQSNPVPTHSRSHSHSHPHQHQHSQHQHQPPIPPPYDYDPYAGPPTSYAYYRDWYASHHSHKYAHPASHSHAVAAPHPGPPPPGPPLSHVHSAPYRSWSSYTHPPSPYYSHAHHPPAPAPGPPPNHPSYPHQGTIHNSHHQTSVQQQQCEQQQPVQSHNGDRNSNNPQQTQVTSSSRSHSNQVSHHQISLSHAHSNQHAHNNQGHTNLHSSHSSPPHMNNNNHHNHSHQHNQHNHGHNASHSQVTHQSQQHSQHQKPHIISTAAPHHSASRYLSNQPQTQSSSQRPHVHHNRDTNMVINSGMHCQNGSISANNQHRENEDETSKIKSNIKVNAEIHDDKLKESQIINLINVDNNANNVQDDNEREHEKELNARFLFQEHENDEHENEASSNHEPDNISFHETDDGQIEDNKDIQSGNNNPNLSMVSEKNPSMFDEDEEYMNELKEEEIPNPSNKLILNDNCVDCAKHTHSAHSAAKKSSIDELMPIQSKPPQMVREVTNPNPFENGRENESELNDENDCKLNIKIGPGRTNGEEKEMEGGFAVPPQRLLVLVPSQIEFKTIQSILPSNSRNFSFSKKLNISGLVCPAFTRDMEQESMAEAPGEQNRLFIVQCGTGLINVSLSIASVVQTVSIDAILLLGSAISLQPKSIKPGHLLLPNTVIQHDICLNTNNKAIFRTHCKLSSWLRTLIAKGSGKENESLPTIYRGTLLSGSEIIKSETRISHLANMINNTPKHDGDQDNNDDDDDDEDEDEDGDNNQSQQSHQQQQSEEENEPSKDGDDNTTTVLYDDAMAVDRESIAVAIICRQLRIPFCVLKSIAPPRFNMNANFEDLYENDDVTFDCTASIPLIKALLKEYTVFNY